MYYVLEISCDNFETSFPIAHSMEKVKLLRHAILVEYLMKQGMIVRDSMLYSSIRIRECTPYEDDLIKLTKQI